MITKFIHFNPLDGWFKFHNKINPNFHPSIALNEDTSTIKVSQTKDKALVSYEVPGVDEKDISIQIQNQNLTIEAKRKESLEEGTFYHQRERYHGDYNKMIKLPFEVDHNSVEATFKEGVLKISLPRAESSKPKQIKIQNT